MLSVHQECISIAPHKVARSIRSTRPSSHRFRSRDPRGIPAAGKDLSPRLESRSRSWAKDAGDQPGEGRVVRSRKARGASCEAGFAREANGSAAIGDSETRSAIRKIPIFSTANCKVSGKQAGSRQNLHLHWGRSIVAGTDSGHRIDNDCSPTNAERPHCCHYRALPPA